jgi:hypothetical protein
MWGERAEEERRDVTGVRGSGGARVVDLRCVTIDDVNL